MQVSSLQDLILPERLAAKNARLNLKTILDEEKLLDEVDDWVGNISIINLCPFLHIGIEPNGLRGVFATHKLSKGLLIGEYTGEKIYSLAEVKDRLKNNSTTYIIQLNKKLWIDGEFEGNNLALINHSCNNNNCKLIRLSPTKVGVILIKNVVPNEFLHYNYLHEFVPLSKNKITVKFPCLCIEDCPNFMG